MIEDDFAGGRNDEGDFVLGIGKDHREVATVMHAAKADTLVPAVDAADDDVRGQGRGIGIAIAEHFREQRAEVIAAHVVGPEDDLLAGRS
ncbi:hypothetical protein D3C84_1003500 [compost metagenome]